MNIPYDLRFPRNRWERLKALIWPDGEWTWVHEFKTCPTGDRHCNHYRWKRHI